MSKECSFDVVSDFDQQELVNAIDQTLRELNARFDLKDSGSTVELEAGKEIVIHSSDELKLRNIFDILEAKVSKRGLNIKILNPGQIESALGGKVRQKIELKKGISPEIGKKIVAELKTAKLKAQGSIQGEQVRVTGKDKDILQEAITLLRVKADEWDIPLQFTNYR
jgi:cyclic-di-GMP-binding protein